MLEILLVDDEPSIRLTVGDALRQAGHAVTLASDGEEALAILAERVFDCVVSDIRLPKANGLDIFRRAKQLAPQTDVILMTAYAAVSDAVSALKEGANDYLTKPFDVDELKLRLDRIMERRRLEAELRDARRELATRQATSSIIGRSPPMLRLIERIETIAGSEAPVLITGESGTGKELAAKSIHQLSSRRDRPFVAVNCAAFPETLLEAELFGHERGAFTGAVKAREGRFKAADGGTLFLDEIAEISPMAQAKLLRVLQEGTIEPLGQNRAVSVDVRVVSATHRNLKERIRDGSFREDLYYRLHVLDLAIPPLRDRRGDMPLLVEYFVRRRLGGRSAPDISPRAWAALTEYRWPGNVRELEHAIERALVLSRGQEIDLDHLPEDVAGDRASTREAPREEGQHIRPLSIAIKAFEREYLLRALAASGGRKTAAADILGISRKNLWEKLRAHGVDDVQAELDRGSAFEHEAS
jgi:DNA-binding NtrC family response regulator